MSKVKDLCRRHEEAIRYIFFGLITMVVSFGVFYLSIWISTRFFGVLENGKDSTEYLIANAIANVLKWCSGVLVAFYTSRKWVFVNADKDVSLSKQLLLFAEGRVVTLILAMILQYLLELLFAVIIVNDLSIFGLTFTAEILGTTAALLIYSVLEVIANYFFSKIFVFKKKKS